MSLKSFAAVLAVALSLLAGSCASAPPPGKALAEAYYNLGNEWFDLKKFDKAAKAYQTALQWNPDLKIATVNWARSKAELGDADGALALLAPLVAADPDNLIVLQYQAWLTAKKSGAAAAADLYAALAQKLPGDATTQFNAGVSLRAAQRPDEALVALQKWKDLDGKNASGLAALAELLEAADSPEAADAWLAAASALPDGDAKRFGPLTHRAKVLEAAQLYGDAADAWTAALAVQPSADQARGEASFRRGALYLLRIEDYQAGLPSLLDAWKAGYKDHDAWAALRENPDLKFSVRLEADLKQAGVEP